MAKVEQDIGSIALSQRYSCGESKNGGGAKLDGLCTSFARDGELSAIPFKAYASTHSISHYLSTILFVTNNLPSPGTENIINIYIWILLTV